MPIARLTALCALSASLALTGCTLQTTATSSPVIAPVSAIAGTVHGGSQPISSARVYLLTPGVSGNAGPSSTGLIPASSANASISLLGSANASGSDSIGNYITTGTDGSFSVTGDYSCTAGTVVSSGTSATLSGTEPIYLYVAGGNPGTGSANTSITLLAALGPCNSPAATATVNELTTVAMAYSLAGYATDPTHISSDSAVNPTFGTLANTGITNAFLNVNNISSVATGMPLTGTPSGSGSVAATTLGTLANMLASCVNGASGSTNCSTLFSNAETSGTTGTEPTDTATAAINLAHNQIPTTASMTALYGLQAGVAAPFAGLSTQPVNLIVQVRYSFSSGYLAYQVAFDSSGNAWIPVGGGGLYSVSPSGVVVRNANANVYGSGQVAIDQGAHLWLAANNGTSSITELSQSGSVLATYTGNGLISPYQIAIDGASNVWVTVGLTSTTTAAVEISNSGSFLSGTTGYPTLGGASTAPATSIAIDGAGSAWLGGRANILQKISSTGAPLSGSTGFTDPDSEYVYNVTLDHAGNAWVGNYGSSLTEFSNSGAILSLSGGDPVAYGSQVYGLNFDGSGNLYYISDSSLNFAVGESNANGVAVPGSVVTTGDSRQLNVATDGSGNLWWANGYNFPAAVEYIGYATPAITPLAAALPATPTADGSSSLGTRP